MEKEKITLIGGGSLQWTPKILTDLVLTNELRGSHICLHDIDEEALSLMDRLGKKIIREAEGDFHLISTTSLEEALQDADYVILSIGVYPVSVGEVPPVIVGIMSKHITNQEMIVEAALTGDKELALQALVNDPLVKNWEDTPRMLDELLQANADYLPQFQL